MLDLITGWKWKLIGGVAAISLFTVSGLLVRSYFENRHLVSEINKLTDSIENPTTGFRARLATETSNRQNLEAAVETQNAALKKQSDDDAAKLAAANAKLATAQHDTLAAQKQIAVLLATPIKGDTPAARMADVDAMVLGDLH